MKSIFTRAYIVIIVLMFFAFVAALIIADNIFENSDSSYFKNEALIEARYIETRLLAIPGSQWAAWVNAYQPLMELKVTLEHEDPDFAGKTRFSGIRSDPWTFFYHLDNSDQQLRMAETSEDFSDIPVEDWLELLIPFAILFSILAGGLLYVARKITQPVLSILDAVDRLGQGDLSARVDEKMPYPVSRLGNGYNRMSERLQRMINEQQILIGAIPHELRSPVGRIRFALDTTRKMKTVQELKSQIEVIDHYLDDLESITEDTLTLARWQSTDSIILERLDLCQLMAELVDDMQGRTDKTIDWHCEPDQPVAGNAALISRALNNLLENAARYARREIKVTMKITQPGRVVIAVEDDGPGIAPAYRTDIFSPYYRIDKSRARDSGGTGLGLALVKLIMEKHGGEVSASASPLGGARLEMTWNAMGDHKILP